MKKNAFLLGLAALALCSAARVQAQWQTVNYTLRGGWNAIYLHGDASHADIGTLFASRPEVLAVWRWNANPLGTQFSSNPSEAHAGSLDWSVWTRGAPAGGTLDTLTGQTAYLVHCAGGQGQTHQISITQRVLPPRATWVRNGANLMGFPVRSSSAPTFSNYFSTFPAVVANGARFYRYAGGELGPANPAQLFAPHLERVDRNQAYWFETPVVGDFYAPVEIVSSRAAGLDYGRSGSSVVVRLRNRLPSPVVVTIAPVDSAPAPAGQPGVSGPVPLQIRRLDPATADYTLTPVSGPFAQTLEARGSAEVEFVLDRGQMSGGPGSFFASLLRFTDDAQLQEVYLPVSASPATLAGLWIGEVSITEVESKAPGSGGAQTGGAFPLRVLFHVDAGGVARLLSRAYLGRLAGAEGLTGLAVREEALAASHKAEASRFVSAHLPLDRVIGDGSGSFAPGSTLSRTVVIPFDDPTNPFVHAYHPDHDNRDARGAPLSAGVESPHIVRECRFTFASAAPGDASAIGWGSSTIGGVYSETITGLHREPITIGGTFRLSRVSEIETITLP